MPTINRGPRRCTPGELKRVGVIISDRHGTGFVLECRECGSEWWPNIPRRGRRLGRHYWVCPFGCNKPDAGA